MRKFILALGAAAALLAASAADATTYVASRAVGDGSLNLSITTDGALGVLTESDITRSRCRDPAAPTTPSAAWTGRPSRRPSPTCGSISAHRPATSC
jgi:hypothetical protein